jgi:ATP-dependent DNA helicase RecG
MPELSGPAAEKLAAAIVAKPEGMHFETKRLGRNTVSKALDTICAFANTEGGILALGVEDLDKARGPDRLYGIEENPEAVDELQRKLRTHFSPPLQGVQLDTVHVKLRHGVAGRLVLVRVPQSAKVHSIVDNGTWLRLPSSNREMTAAEITELMFRRGVASAEGEALDMPLSLIETEHWGAYSAARGLNAGHTGRKLLAIGLGKQVGEAASTRVWPTKAAVLLFAEYPSDVLAPDDVRRNEGTGVIPSAVRSESRCGGADRDGHSAERKPSRSVGAGQRLDRPERSYREPGPEADCRRGDPRSHAHVQGLGGSRAA